jgi:hypothetical protein
VSNKLNDTVSFQKIIDLATISHRRVNIDLDNLDITKFIKDLEEQDFDQAESLIFEPKASKSK